MLLLSAGVFGQYMGWLAVGSSWKRDCTIPFHKRGRGYIRRASENEERASESILMVLTTVSPLEVSW